MPRRTFPVEKAKCSLTETVRERETFIPCVVWTVGWRCSDQHRLATSLDTEGPKSKTHRGSVTFVDDLSYSAVLVTPEPHFQG